METPEELINKLRELCAAGTRERLLARGQARGMIWNNGSLPEDSPQFSTRLSNDLLNHGYLVLGCAIRLRILSLENDTIDSSILDDGFRTAAECIEAVVRRGRLTSDRDFHLMIAAASFHLAHYGARSYSLLMENETGLNLTENEKVLVALMQRRLGELHSLCLNWLIDVEHTDEGIAALLASSERDFDAEDAAYSAISRVFHRAIASFEFAIQTGQVQFVVNAVELLDKCVIAANQLKHVPLWWVCVLSRHLIDDLWDRSLHNTLPTNPEGDPNWPGLRRNFIELIGSRSLAEIDLWPSQLSAVKRVVDENDSLVVALPTSSGKTRIAELCILKCLSGGRRVVYVTPLRALSAQVEVTLARTFKPLGFSVSSVYGASGIGASDVETMQSTSIVIATPEKLDFAIRQDPGVIDDVGLIVLDEGHMIGLSEREVRYEVLVQRLLRRVDSSQRRIVCLSAIFREGDAFDSFTQWIRSDKDGDAIRSKWRPTRQRPATIEWKDDRGWLEFRVGGETVFIPRFVEQMPAKGRRRNAFPQNQKELITATITRFREDGHSVLVYCPIRRSVEPTAESFLKLLDQGYAKSFLTDSAAEAIQLALRIGDEWLGSDHVAMRALRVGVAVHHAQLPRPFLGEIERLLRKRLLNVTISSPTLAQGVDLSFGVMVFTSLWRNGELIPAKEFANVVGRVGRAFVDLDGIYVLPVFGGDSDTRVKRLNEFHRLVRDAKGRELESGLYLLIHVCLWRLGRILKTGTADLEEYVLNQQPAVDKLSQGEGEDAQQLELILAELDAGIFALVDDLECDASEIAEKLDEALKSSLWQRRLAIRPLEHSSQVAVLHGRARHIWTRTTSPQRRGFFSASIGTESGLAIVAQADEFRAMLQSATEAIKSGATDDLVKACCDLAERLFVIHPFRPKIPNGWDDGAWKTVLKTWISGATLIGVTDSVGIAFVQQALVFQLVWAIEAVRLIMETLDEAEDEADTYVAICMTYGVPSVAAARLLEAGMESRILAARLARELDLSFSTRDGMNVWLLTVGDDDPLDLNATERETWKRFLLRSGGSILARKRVNRSYRFLLGEGIKLEIGSRVRLISNDEGTAEIYSTEFDWLGQTVTAVKSDGSLCGVILNKDEIVVSHFEEPETPSWFDLG